MVDELCDLRLNARLNAPWVPARVTVPVLAWYGANGNAINDFIV